MNDFLLYFNFGFDHVLDLSAYDHILFFIVLAAVFNFNQWKKGVWLVTFFTIGHSVALALSVYEVIKIKTVIIEFLIPLTIFITGATNVLTARKAASDDRKLNLIFALLFGTIHGFGFTNGFKSMIGRQEDKLFPLLEFSLGVETAQIIVVLIILILGTVLQNFFRVTKRDWILVCSSIVIGFSLQMMIIRFFW